MWFWTKITLDPGGCRTSGGKRHLQTSEKLKLCKGPKKEKSVCGNAESRFDVVSVTSLLFCVFLSNCVCVVCYRDSREEALGEYYMRKYAKSSGGEQWVSLFLCHVNKSSAVFPVNSSMFPYSVKHSINVFPIVEKLSRVPQWVH